MILVDFETRSRCDLRKHGGRLYAEHPSTEAICAVLCDTDTGDVGAWTPGDPDPAPGAVLAAHNATGFDAHVARALGWKPAAWVDTSELARRAGLPGALDALGTRWLNRPKDAAGSRFTLGLSRPSRAAARRGLLPDLTPAVVARVVAYCASDVEILAHGWDRLRPYLEDGTFSGWEGEVSRVDRVVNDRGIAFDSDLACHLLEADAANSDRAIDAAARVLHWTSDRTRALVSSPAQFTGATGATDAQAATVAALLAVAEARIADDAGGTHDTARHVAALCRARQALATIAAGKLRAGLAHVSPDGRLRDSHRYYGAHTGRWSGRGMQLQNLPRPEGRFSAWGDAEVCALADRRGSLDEGEIMLALRACLTASPGGTLAVCDFSGVEARALAWCAGDAAALDVFASMRDPYKTAAAMIFGVPYDSIDKVQRGVGKVAELACGYGMGPDKFAITAAAAGASLGALGLDARDVVRAWRRLHAPIVAFWRRLEDAFRGAVHGVEARVDRFRVVPSADGADVAIFLPSERPIIYPDAGVDRDGGLFYHGARGVEHLYGGKLTENVIQALCRDLMADALVRAEAAGLAPVLHVHDEIVCDVPGNAGADALEELHAIMVTVPDWAAGFPAGAAGHHGKRYRK